MSKLIEFLKSRKKDFAPSQEYQMQAGVLLYLLENR